MTALVIDRWRPAALAALFALSACAHYDPHPVLTSPTEIAAVSASGRASISFVHTDPADDAQVLDLRVEPSWTHEGGSWSGISAVTVLDEAWDELSAETWEAPGSDARTVRFSLTTDLDERTLHVLVDRPGAPQQRFDVRVRLTEARVALAPRVEVRARDAWLAATYPIWGLPRDLLDAPLTGLNRFGLGKIYGGETFEDPVPPVVGLYAASGVVGLFWGAAWGFHEAGHHYLQSYLYASGGALFGAVVGAGAVAALDLAWGAVVNPLQVGLLRTGVDRAYVKTTSPRIELDGRWSEADLRQYDTLLRSHAIFPNWRYVVNARTVSAPADEDLVSILTVSELEIVEP